MFNRESKQTKKDALEFNLTGQVGYRFSGQDHDDWIGASLKDSFLAKSLDEAIEISRGRIKNFLQVNKEHLPPPNPEDNVDGNSFYFTLSQQNVWTMEYVPEKPGKPARAKIPAIPAHIIEET